MLILDSKVGHLDVVRGRLAGATSPVVRRWRVWAGVLLITVAVDVGAMDSDMERLYVSFRGRDTDQITGTSDLWGGSIGMNFNRYLGAEVAVDTYEISLDAPDGITLGEYSVLPIMSELRLRYPLFNDRFTPYAIVGGGLAYTQFNDRKRKAAGRRLRTESSSFAGVFGGGFEFFVTDSIALGLEARYLYMGEQDARVDGTDFGIDASRWMVQVGARMFTSQVNPRPLVQARDPVPSRLYFSPRVGVGTATPTTLASGIKLETEPSGVGPFNQFYGLALGADFGARWGFEVSAEAYESRLAVESIGQIGEYGIYPILGQFRVRFPLDGGRWVPYLLAGGGVTFGEFNDRSTAGEKVFVDIDGVAPAFSVGGGIEWFAASNVSFHVEAKYIRSLRNEFKIADRRFTTDVGTFAMTFGLRAYLFDI